MSSTPFLLKMAALFTRMSTPPKRSRAAADRRDHLALVGNVAGHRGGASARALDVTRAVGSIFGARIDAYDRGALGRETLRDTAADIRAGPGDQRHFSSLASSRIQRGGGAVRKHFEELKIHVSINSVSAGLRFSSASTPARHIQLRISCCPLASTDDAG